MAAITAISTFVKAGEHVVCSNMTYGGTFRYYTKIQARYGVEFSFVDTSDEDAVQAAFRPNTKLLHLESPTNPTMRLCDIARLSAFAHERGAIVVVDNTFCSPYLQKPLALGADIVMHSTTKFLNGHSDSIGGIAVAAKPEHVEWLSFVQNSSGRSSRPSTPGSCCAASRRWSSAWSGTRRTAARSREWLAEQKTLRKVNYPGLPDHPEHELAKRQMTGFGAMISFDLGSYEKASAFLATRARSARSARAWAASRRSSRTPPR